MERLHYWWFVSQVTFSTGEGSAPPEISTNFLSVIIICVFKSLFKVFVCRGDFLFVFVSATFTGKNRTEDRPMLYERYPNNISSTYFCR